jgi:hypothetical protein
MGVAGVLLGLGLAGCTSSSSPLGVAHLDPTGPHVFLGAADARPFAEGAEADLEEALAADPVDFHQQTRACIQLAELARRLDPTGLPIGLFHHVAEADMHCPDNPDQALADIRRALAVWPTP